MDRGHPGPVPSAGNTQSKVDWITKIGLEYLQSTNASNPVKKAFAQAKRLAEEKVP
jgi:hypothetical protein